MLRTQIPVGHRRDRWRRRIAARFRRRSGRHDQLLPLHRSISTPTATSSLSPRSQKDFNVVARLLCRRTLCQLRRGRCRSAADGRQVRQQGKVYGGAQGREPERYAARADQVRPSRQCHRHLLRSPCREGRAASSLNKTVKTYPNVSQFWTYDEKKFLAQPVYSRDYPPLKNADRRCGRGRRAPAPVVAWCGASEKTPDDELLAFADGQQHHASAACCFFYPRDFRSFLG